METATCEVWRYPWRSVARVECLLLFRKSKCCKRGACSGRARGPGSGMDASTYYRAKWAVALHAAGYHEAAIRIAKPLSRERVVPLEVRLTIRKLLDTIEAEKGRDWLFGLEPEP